MIVIKGAVIVIILDLLAFFLFLHDILSISGWLLLVWIWEIVATIIIGGRMMAKYKDGAMGCLFLMHQGEHPKEEILSDFTNFILGFCLILPGPLAMLAAGILLPPPSRRFCARRWLSWYERRHPPKIIDL